jgi:CheY-like chemotaxis protein
VELHGGRVSVESAGADRGTSFKVMLPVRAVAAASVVPADRPSQRASFSPAPAPAGLGGLRILVVDDESDTRELLETILASEGAIVETAESAREAMTVLARFPADVLLSDIGMPGEDGYALLRLVRAKGVANGGALPAIALTAYARTEDRARAAAAGYTAFLTKPVDLEELLKVVRGVGVASG